MAAIAPASVLALVGPDDGDVAPLASVDNRPDAVPDDQRRLPDCVPSARPPMASPHGRVDPLPPAPIPPAWMLLPPATCRGVADLLS